MNKKFFTLLVFVLCFFTELMHAQQEDKRIKIEITLKDGNKTIKAAVRSATFSFTRSVNNFSGTESKENKETNNYYFSLDFEKQDIALLAVFMKNKGGVDGQITMTDSYGKLPSRKFDFTKARIDSLSDQINADYSSSYFSLICSSMIIDGVNLN
ncbi:hypothetical protein [Flavobacterium foetidum]|uniref:hypothetical protein n=1 Tax=Flavobacterium foetidum TaxID=2026681 RepID=UPI00107531FE|nr:hypothetical protein [Flavobacterium foetidum]KAF2508289.1 hypothetical protein E0W73_19775 [Flavobacterium foetidum]